MSSTRSPARSPPTRATAWSTRPASSACIVSLTALRYQYCVKSRSRGTVCASCTSVHSLQAQRKRGAVGRAGSSGARYPVSWMSPRLRIGSRVPWQPRQSRIGGAEVEAVSRVMAGLLTLRQHEAGEAVIVGLPRIAHRVAVVGPVHPAEDLEAGPPRLGHELGQAGRVVDAPPLVVTRGDVLALGVPAREGQEEQAVRPEDPARARQEAHGRVDVIEDAQPVDGRRRVGDAVLRLARIE